jgi:hypothetical protein
METLKSQIAEVAKSLLNPDFVDFDTIKIHTMQYSARKWSAWITFQQVHRLPGCTSRSTHEAVSVTGTKDMERRVLEALLARLNLRVEQARKRAALENI